MTLDRWWRERERDQLYAGADGGLRPLPLVRGGAWRPPTTSYWVVMRENAEAEPILVLTRREGAGFVLTRDHSN